MTGEPDVYAGKAAVAAALDAAADEHADVAAWERTEAARLRAAALDDRIAALVDAAPPPSEAMLDRIADLLAPDGAHA